MQPFYLLVQNLLDLKPSLFSFNYVPYPHHENKNIFNKIRHCRPISMVPHFIANVAYIPRKHYEIAWVWQIGNINNYEYNHIHHHTHHIIVCLFNLQQTFDQAMFSRNKSDNKNKMYHHLDSCEPRLFFTTKFSKDI